MSRIVPIAVCCPCAVCLVHPVLADSGGSGDEHSPQKRRGRGKRAAAGGKRRAAAHASDDSDASDPPAPTAGASSKRARVAQGRKSGTARSGASAASGADTLPPQTAAGAVGLAGLHLVVFEEADLLLDDDKGFISTLATLISDTKVSHALTYARHAGGGRGMIHEFIDS